MLATSTPQAVAIVRSRRRCCGVAWWGAFIARSQWTVEHARALHQRDDVEQDDERAEHQRDRDRARAPAALLLLGEHDLFGLHLFGLGGHRISKPSRRRTADKAAPAALDQQDGEEQEQVEDR